MSKKKYHAALFVLLVLFLVILSRLERSSLPEPAAECQEHVSELAALRLQVSAMRNKLSSLGVNASELMLDSLPIIYVVTPTHYVPTQKADLTRMMNTLRHVVNLHWILVEDAEERSAAVQRLLAESGLAFTHLVAATPPHLRSSSKEARWVKPRGVLQRNAGIEWLRANVQPTSARHTGVVYFADDDNTYSLQLFQEIRSINGVGVWPVGLVGGVYVERPEVRAGRVTGWLAAWRPDRQFAVDMAGFAVSTRLLLEYPDARFSTHSKLGFLESDFLSSLGVRLIDLEVKASMCTKVLVWHTQTKAAVLHGEITLKKSGKAASNFGIEV